MTKDDIPPRKLLFQTPPVGQRLAIPPSGTAKSVFIFIAPDRSPHRSPVRAARGGSAGSVPDRWPSANRESSTSARTLRRSSRSISGSSSDCISCRRGRGAPAPGISETSCAIAERGQVEILQHARPSRAPSPPPIPCRDSSYRRDPGRGRFRRAPPLSPRTRCRSLMPKDPTNRSTQSIPGRSR